MVRKQLYLHKRHALLLKKLARARGVSEAEIVRQAIEHEAAGHASPSTWPDRAAWEEILGFVAARRALGSASTAAYRWDRQDAYEECESRYGQHRDPGAGQ